MAKPHSRKKKANVSKTQKLTERMMLAKINQIAAEAKKTLAEAKRIEAETKKTAAETKEIQKSWIAKHPVFALAAATILFPGLSGTQPAPPDLKAMPEEG